MSRIRDESGFTLVELLITIGIIGVVLAPIAASIIVILLNTNDTAQRYSESHDAQLLSAYFVSDAQSMSAATVGTITCGDSVGVTPVIEMSWTDPGDDVAATDDEPRKVAYVITCANGVQGDTELQLVRRRCEGTTTTPADTSIMVHLLSTSVASPASAVCDSAACNSVTMTVTEESGYSFSLTGARRYDP